MSDVDTEQWDLRVNLSGVAVGFEALPAGTYNMTVEEWEMTETGPKSKTPGAPMVKWTFAVDGGEFEGRKIFSNNTFSKGALPFFKELLVATGRFKSEQLNGEIDVEEACNEILDAHIRVTVKVRDYEGDDTNQIKRIRPVGDGKDGSADSIDDLLP